MRSVKNKITTITMCIAIIAMSISAAVGVMALRSVGTSNADQVLLLMCETGQKNLDHDFQSVEQSVAMVSAYVESDLDGLSEEQLQAHLARVKGIFTRIIGKTDGVLTYYYRIDPAVSQTAKGFWYVSNDEGFFEHEVTDITQYNTLDTSALVWFTVPKTTGKPVWLPPYITENLGARVISYNVPIYHHGRFVGVIGIELDYTNLAKMVDNITLYDNGYAFVNDAKGKIIYHSRMDVLNMAEQPKVPNGLLSNNKFVHYTFEGVEKQAVWLPLSNGLRLNLCVPVEEINAEWHNWSIKLVAIITVLLILSVAVIKSMVGVIIGNRDSSGKN